MPPASARFPATAWTDCIRVVQQPDHPDFVLQVDHLIATYWRPVFHFLRTKGHTLQDAEDLTQEFFVADLPDKLRSVDRNIGTFRNFLKTLVHRFAIDRTVRSARWKFQTRFVSVHSLVQDEDRAFEPAAGGDPEEAFERQWKTEVLASVRRNLQACYDGNAADRSRYEIFAAYHLGEGTGERPTQEELATQFGVTRDFVRGALEKLQARYERLVRQEVREQVESEEEVEVELRALLN